MSKLWDEYKKDPSWTKAVELLRRAEGLDVAFVTPHHKAEVRKHFDNLVRKYAAKDFSTNTSQEIANVTNDAINLARGHLSDRETKLEEMSLDDLTELEFQISNEIARRGREAP